jgi:hypothetical protein
MSTSIAETLDTVAGVDRDEKSASIGQALDQIRNILASYNGIELPQLAIGPLERVLAFNVNNRIVLNDPGGKVPYFSSTGFLTDLSLRPLPGSKIETTLPVDLSQFGGVVQWPNPQKPPFGKPPVDGTNTAPGGSSRQAYDFGNGNTLVSVGPAVPKLTLVKGGGAQFWVGAVGVITQGTGEYDGVRGTSAYVGSAYFAQWPNKPKDQIGILAAGFPVLVTTYVKLVLKENLT